MMRSAVVNRVMAIARRDAIIELSYQFQLGIRFVSLLVGIFMFYFLGELIGDSAALADYRGGYFEFALIGLLVMNFSQVSVSALSEAIQEAQEDGSFEIVLSTPTSLPTLMAGSYVVPLCFACLDAAVYLVAGWLLVGFSVPVESLLLAALLLTLTVGTFAAVGIVAASVIVLSKRGDPFSSLVLMASNLLAGAIFPVTVLPDWLQTLSRAVPASYGLHGIREVVLGGGGLSDVWTDIVVLLGFNAVMLPASLWALSRAVRMARIAGTLGND